MDQVKDNPAVAEDEHYQREQINILSLALWRELQELFGDNKEGWTRLTRS